MLAMLKEQAAMGLIEEDENFESSHNSVFKQKFRSNALACGEKPSKLLFNICLCKTSLRPLS